MIRTRLEGIAQVDDDLRNINQFASDFERVAGELYEESFRAVEPSFLGDLQFYPLPKRGSRYRRTGRLKRGWTLRFIKNGAAYQIVVSNAVPYTKWVQGSFDQRRNYQTQMHKETGWVLANATVNFWHQVILEEFQERHAKYLEGLGVFNVTRRNR